MRFTLRVCAEFRQANRIHKIALFQQIITWCDGLPIITCNFWGNGCETRLATCSDRDHNHPFRKSPHTVCSPLFLLRCVPSALNVSLCTCRAVDHAAESACSLTAALLPTCPLVHRILASTSVTMKVVLALALVCLLAPSAFAYKWTSCGTRYVRCSLCYAAAAPRIR